MLLLLAEDDERLGKLLLHLLKKDGYQADWALDGLEALSLIDNCEYDLAVLDWMMPEMDGIELCQRLRERGFSGGILMLTAKDTLQDRIIGLDSGADDYLVKPFEYDELSARLRALSRRSRQPLTQDRVEIGAITVDRNSKSAYIGEDTLNLSRREFQLLDLLLRNRGRTVPREVIIDRVWGMDGEVTDNNLDAFIRLLRKKLETNGQPRVIVNIRGIGYRLEV